MCGGGGGGGGAAARITEPNYQRFDRMADRRMDAMRAVQAAGTDLLQLQLNQALGAQGAALAQLRDAKVARANETAANAARLATLLGAPPPEKTAKAPVIGADRTGMAKAKGKRGLRIDRAPGLSITA